jgi:hypothetical protein
MEKDNNGVGLVFPAVAPLGAATLQGAMILGIDTQSNNSPGDVTAMAADGNGTFSTRFNNVTQTSSFIDSGSNELYFPGPAGVATCAGYSSPPQPFCPPSPVTLTAVQIAADHSHSLQIAFQIINSIDAVSTGNAAFSNLGASVSAGFAWGLPFFLGHTIWVGISGTSSSAGVGPYWAY